MTEPLWSPSPEQMSAARLTRFMASIRATTGLPITRYEDLYDWSIGEPAAFWSALWDFFEVRHSRRADSVLQDADRMPGARWFEGARLNFSENLLRRRDDHLALIFANEAGERRQLSYAELYQQVAQLAAALRGAGVQPGDRVAAFIPNIPEAFIGMLASASLGAVWSSCSPDFGTGGVLDRFGQIAPKILIAADGYHYAGKRLSSLPRVAELADQLPDLRQVVVIPYLQAAPDLSGISRAMTWDAFLQPASEIIFEQLPFDHPLYILYSSGTTGVPKCIVHGAGGTLLQHLKEHHLHSDVGPDDVLFYYTTCGWMMWNWLASGLACEATLAVFDGSPFHPSPTVLFDFAQQVGISVFGTSAKYLSALDKAGVKPGSSHHLPRLKSILSTGSPLLPESYDYVYREFAPQVRLSSIAGGTDIVSCFTLGNPLLPVYRGEIQCRGLGMRVEVFNDHGQPVLEEKGELVCSAPFPSMPIGFWNDPGGKKYHAAYFERYPGVWHHGDFAEITRHGGVVIHGRSDTVLNPGGVRIGTAEIYRQVETIPEILESMVIGQDWRDDVRVILFVRMQPGHSLTPELIQTIRERIKSGASPRHVPAKVIEVPDIPRTRSGKIVELAVRHVVHGQAVKNQDALANPEALAYFRNLEELGGT